jgi:nitroreductase
MDFSTLVRTRRTHKAYDPAPVDPETLDALFDLARWAPNHHLTNPWRFRVLGPAALEALKAAAGPEHAAKLDRAPTLVAVSATQSGEDAAAHDEDVAATACAALIVLLAAHERGLGGYWRTPAVLRTPEGRAACAIGPGEKVLGLLHLGHFRGDKPAPERAPLDAIRTYLS